MKSDITTIDATVSAASRTTYGGGITAVIGWITSIDMVSLAGFIVALVGLAVNVWFQWQRNRREEAQHELRRMESEAKIQAYRNGYPPTR